MRLLMAGIDYKTADVAVRERFSTTTSASVALMKNISEVAGIQGCVLLSTCNRTELYLCCEDAADLDAVALLCRENGADLQQYRRFFRVRSGRQAAMHLMMVTAGLRSQIRGEDQILTQVKQAVESAREVEAIDPVLETLFRCAVSAAKQAKTEVPISPVETSVARRAVEVLRDQCGSLKNSSALVIGNGEMGQLTASMLAQLGCRVTVTVRSYRRGIAVIPDGCSAVPYEERYRYIGQCDILISATASPHFTVCAEMLEQGDSVPRYLVDLAVPRDIEPEAGDLPGVLYCWNVDTLGGNLPDQAGIAKLVQMKSIMEVYLQRFYKWESYRACLPVAGGAHCG